MPSQEIPTDFKFNMDSYVILAQIMLKVDRNLEAKRHSLVPDLIEEDDFWRNYFYKIKLFKDELGVISQDEGLDLENSASQNITVEPRTENSDIELQQITANKYSSEESSILVNI